MNSVMIQVATVAKLCQSNERGLMINQANTKRPTMQNAGGCDVETPRKVRQRLK